MNFKVIHNASFILANSEEVEKGDVACIDLASGQAVLAQEAADLIPVGRFDEAMTGNGTALVKVALFSPKRIHFFAQDGDDPVAVGDTLGPCYFTGANTVGVPSDTSGVSMAGRVWIVEATRVGVETADSIGLQGAAG